MMQLVAQSMDTAKAIRNLANKSMDNTETIRDLIDKSMNNREASNNHATLVQSSQCCKAGQIRVHHQIW